MAGQKITACVVGYGLSAKVFHIPLILTTRSMVLHSIVQRTPSASSSASADHPNAKIYNSTAPMLEDPSIDLVVITTPPDTHYALCTAALTHNKHVLVEKPFVPTTAEANSLIALAHKSNRLICIYQNRRWDGDFLTFLSLHKAGTLGRVVEFESHFDRWKPARPDSWKGSLGMEHGGGVIYDLGTHLIDQIVLVFGLPRAVFALFAAQRNDGATDPDAITVLLKYADGLVATVKSAVMSLETEQLRYWIRGSKGTYKKFHLDVQEDQLKAGLKPGDEGFGIESEGMAGTLTVLEGDKPVTKPCPNVTPLTYGALYDELAEAIEKGDEGLVPVKASEARDVLRVIEAAKESAKTGKTVML